MKTPILSFVFLLLPAMFSSACNNSTKNVHDAPSAVIWQDDSTDTNNALMEQTLYTPRDSAEVVEILKKDLKSPDVLTLARHFVNRPYVAGTLEGNDPEKLVVDLRQLDCATLVETVGALIMTKRQGGDKFSDFCRNLENIRYRDSHINGYLSRLHYFSWWKRSNTQRGIISEVKVADKFTVPLYINIHFMSKHSEKYPYLVAHPQEIDSIAAMERSSCGRDGGYIPKRFTSLSKTQLPEIQDGDIIAIVTSKQGLDYAHLGFAVWGKDSKLHLLNASMIYKKVVEDSTSLHDYLSKHKSFIGIRVFRF